MTNKKPCKCLDETLAEFKEKCVTPQMKKKPHVPGTLITDWAGRVFFFSESPTIPIPLKIVTEYRPIKKNGEPAKGKKKLENFFTMNYCPFCGVRWKPYTIKDLAEHLQKSYLEQIPRSRRAEFNEETIISITVNWFNDRNDEGLLILRMVSSNGSDLIMSFEEDFAKKYTGIYY